MNIFFDYIFILRLCIWSPRKCFIFSYFQNEVTSSEAFYVVAWWKNVRLHTDA